MSKRTRIYAKNTNHVVLEMDDKITGERVTYEYFAPSNGGYVRLWHPSGKHPQVCHGLANRGPTLTCEAGELLNTIRREYHRAKRLEAA